MIKKSVYIETTIPSFYYEDREDPEFVAIRIWTREWWDDIRSTFHCFTSEAVLDELEKGNYPNKANILKLMDSIEILPFEPEVVEIVEAYIAHHVMPDNPIGDALHLAIASYHKCDYLLTWNCRHLANANKFHHIQRVNSLLGLYIPLLVTPLELLGEEEQDER